MLRLPASGAFFAAAIAFAPAVLADELSYGEGPAVTLIRNGLTGSGNQLEKAPAVAVKIDKLDFVPGKTTFKDLDDALGIEQYTLGEGGDAFTWSCVLSPADANAPAALIFFGSDTKGDASTAVEAFAYETHPTDDIPPGCFMSEKPLAVTTGVPGLGATQADLETAFGPKPEMDANGTVGYYFGGEPKGDGTVSSKELKYRVIDGKVVAAKFGVVTELE
ncbi:hypothetical protein sos41_13740 [Alphaproteobacteria bacterium SO-S41]|nr:hypothetical protein sos41_13740 [Alphaproteobacteria bacterium SO-S41]